MEDPKTYVGGRLPSLRETLVVWGRIGCLSFGGPAGQIALMHRVLVEERRWIGEERFLHALSYCMLLPGPEAQQLATYIGWLMHGVRGGLVAGALFILPGALVMLGLSIAYAQYHDLPAVSAVFLGVKAVVLAIVIEAIFRIGRKALKGRIPIAIAAAAFVGIYFLRIPFPVIVLGAAVIGWVGYLVSPSSFKVSGGHGPTSSNPVDIGLIDTLIDRGKLTHITRSWKQSLKTLAIWLIVWLVPVIALRLSQGPHSVWAQIGEFFSLMAVVTFGGAYAVLAYVAQAAVQSFGWLAPHEMVDGLGLAETTPGPLILVLQFVGFLAAYRAPDGLNPLTAGTLGALLTLWVTFVPCFTWIFVGAPYIEKLRSNKALAAALNAVTAAIVGVVTNLALWFVLHVLFRTLIEVDAFVIRVDVPDPRTLEWKVLIFGAAAIIAMLRFKQGALRVLIAGSIGGLLIARI